MKPVKGYEGNYEDLGINKFDNITMRLKEGKFLIIKKNRICKIRFEQRKDNRNIISNRSRSSRRKNVHSFNNPIHIHLLFLTLPPRCWTRELRNQHYRDNPHNQYLH